MRSARLIAVSTVALVAAAVAAVSVQNVSTAKLLVRNTGAKHQIVLQSTDAQITLAGVGDPVANGVAIHVYGASDDECLVLPGGSEWKNKKGKTFRYKSKATKNVVLVKDGKLVVSLKSVDYLLNDAGSQGAINAQVQFGTGTRFCMRCTGNKKDEATKVLGKACAAAACDPEPSTCGGGGGGTTTSTTLEPGGTTTTTLVSSSGFRGVLGQTTGRFNFAMTIGIPGANAACNTTFPGSHVCTYAELQAAQAADQLIGVSATSFWAIIPEHANNLQCASSVPWDYQTAHTGEYGERVTVDGTTGSLGPLQSGNADNVFCAGQSSVACCQ